VTRFVYIYVVFVSIITIFSLTKLIVTFPPRQTSIKYLEEESYINLIQISLLKIFQFNYILPYV